MNYIEYKMEDFQVGDLIILDKKLTAYNAGISADKLKRILKKPQKIKEADSYNLRIEGCFLAPVWVTAIVTEETHPEYFI